MSSLPKSHDVDLESGSSNEVAAASEGDAPPRLSNANGENKTKHERMESSVSECSVEINVDLHIVKIKRDCRICQLSMDATNHDSRIPIELGCSCKDDLAAAHKQCAEAWFKIKGDKTCEICGSIAQNISGITEFESTEQWSDGASTGTVSAPLPLQPPPHSQSRSLWHGHRFLNFLLACMVFAFVVSWLFHFNIPS